MRFDFIKAHGLGNDFIIINTNYVFSQKDIKFLCDRKFGIGADQVLIYDDNLNVLIWNQDGSSASACGNGFRAICKILGSRFVVLSAPCGLVRLENLDSSLVKSSFDLTPSITKISNSCYEVFVGNWHRIYFSSEDPSVFADPDFNISCICKTDQGWKIRTYERGVGHTLACGSAALAAANLLHSLGFEALDLNFEFDTVFHVVEDSIVKQIGPAAISFWGSIDL